MNTIKITFLYLLIVMTVCCSGSSGSNAKNDVPKDDLQFSSLTHYKTSSSFEISVDITGDDNRNSLMTMYYCNNTDNPGCDPELSGISIVMERNNQSYSASVHDLSSDSIGDEYKISVVASDPDGTTGFPLEAKVTIQNNTDTTAPSPINDLSIVNRTSTGCQLTWTASGDDQTRGRASSYDMRYSTHQILNDADFITASPVSGLSEPSQAGTSESHTITNLNNGTTYYFAIKVTDDSANQSSMSNVVSAKTLSPEICQPTYNQTLGDGWAAVGNSEDRNTYRGLYWTGETKKICSVEIELGIQGNISGINYKVTVWNVDVQNDLLCSNLIATSDIVSGSSISSDSDKWITFDFNEEVTLTSGNTVVLLSRQDAGTKDSSNYVSVAQNYDESDSESRQWNIHYYSSRVMAGRSAGDEDQPEYFACNFKFMGYNSLVSSHLEFPNMPEDITASALNSNTVRISWFERGKNNLPVDHYNIYHYNTNSGASSYIGSSKETHFDHTGLLSGSTHTYLVRAVSVDGNEGFHSIKNGTGWQTTTP